MGQFKPFSLGDAVQAGQAIRMNNLKIQSAELGLAKEQKMRGLAQMSTAPVYGPAEGPPEPFIGGGAEIQTGTQFSPKEYQQNLANEGLIDESMALQDKISKMNKAQRAEAEYRTKKIGQLVFSAKGNPQLWDQGQQQAIDNGWLSPEQAVPYSDQAWQTAMDSTQKMSDLLEADKTTSPYGKIDITDFTNESLKVYEKTGVQSDLVPIDDLGKTTGSSEFERGLNRLVSDEVITGEESLKLLRKRIGVLSGSELTKNQEISSAQRVSKEKSKQTNLLAKESKAGLEHFSNINTSVDAAIAAVQSGDNGLADTMLSQAMSQVQDSKVRAFQMYKEFDKSFGNIAERVVRGIGRFAKGKRTDAEVSEIIETLKNFKENYSLPALNNMKSMYRDMARGRKLDPFDVVPPTSPEEIRDYPGLIKEEKLKYLKLHFPEKFQ